MKYALIAATIVATTCTVTASEQSAFSELDAEFNTPPNEKVIIKKETVYVPVAAPVATSASMSPAPVAVAAQSSHTNNHAPQAFNNVAFEITHLSTSANADKTKLITRMNIRNKLNNTTWLESYRTAYITDSNGNKWKIESYNSLRSEVQFTPQSSSKFQFVFNLQNPPEPGEPALTTFKEPLFFSSTLRYKLKDNREAFNVGFNDITLN